MAISRSHTWSAGEVLLASDLNAEYNNILNNAADLVSPFTKAISMGGFALNFDAANTIALTAATNGISLTGGAFNTAAGADIASAATVNLDTATGNIVDVTGAVTWTAVTLSQGRWRLVRHTGAQLLTHGASMVLPGAANITTASGDYSLWVGYASSVVRCALFLPSENIPASKIVTTKGDILVASAARTLARTGVGSDGQSLLADSSQTNGLVYIDNPARPNLLINSNWQVDQINEGALYTVNTTDVRGPDGWSGTIVGTGVFKLRTLADPDNAALKCLEITCTTADAAIAAADDYFIYSAIEGYDAAALMAGTSSAQAITVQFKFKTSVTGVYGVSVANSALNRRYVGIITVADTSEHEYSVSLTMDTTGTWLYTNGVGTYLRLCLAAGSNFQATAGAWAAGAEQTTSAQCNFMSNIANIAYLKRIQLITGALVQAYRPADLQKELAKAQRYYFKTFNQGTAPAQNAGAVGALFGVGSVNTVAFGSYMKFPVSMRTAPTITTYATDAATANWSTNVTTPVASTSNPGIEGVSVVGATNVTAGSGYNIHVTATARIS